MSAIRQCERPARFSAPPGAYLSDLDGTDWGLRLNPVYRIETSWPSVGQALTRRLTRCDPLSRTDFMSILQLPFGSSISTNTALPGSKTAEPSRSSCQFSAPSSEA